MTQEHFSQLLKLEQTCLHVVRSPTLCWLYLSYCLWLRRVCCLLPEQVRLLTELLAHAYPFFVLVLKDRLVLENRKNIAHIKNCSRFLNKAKSKGAASIFDVFTEYIRKKDESSEDDDEPNLTKVPSSQADALDNERCAGVAEPVRSAERGHLRRPGSQPLRRVRRAASQAAR